MNGKQATEGSATRNPASKSILVIGDGIIGRCTAYYAVRKGHRVTILESGPSDHDGCSFGNAGLVVPSHFVPLAAPGAVELGVKWMFDPESPFHVKPRLDRDLFDWGWRFCQAANAEHVSRSAPLLRDLHLASRTCYEELAGELNGDFGLVKKGLLVLCKGFRALDEEATLAVQARALGIPAEVLTARQTAELEPGIRMEVAGSVYFPVDCHLTPARFMAGLRSALEQSGTRFCWSTQATGCCVWEDRVVRVYTPKGEFAADEVVVCGGAWSSEFLSGLRIRLPMQAGKGYSLTLPHPRQLPSLSLLLAEARVAVTPMNGTLRFGGTMEIAGLNEEINARRVEGLIKSALDYFPEFTRGDFQGIEPWGGLRPCSPDGLPYVGRLGGFANLSIATGHAMLGVSLAPITGKVMAQILSDEEPSLDLGLLRPGRHEEGWEVSLKRFLAGRV